MIVVLAGGVGAARFLEGLIRVVPQRKITIIGNVGDDTEIHGLRISPDLDIVTYTLAGLVDPVKGWGFRGDTFECQEILGKYGYETWFNLGDRDLATHIYRTEQLRKGQELSQITQQLIRRLGLQIRLLPATNDPMQTHVLTDKGWIQFQEYMVKHKTNLQVRRVKFEGARSARPTRGVIDSIANATGVIVAPSNPIVSIGAILAIQGIRSALRQTKQKVVGISPIIGGKTVKGPANKLMKACGIKPSALGVAECYEDFMDTLIIDRVDKRLARGIERLGIKPVVADTLMKDMRSKKRLAYITLGALKN